MTPGRKAAGLIVLALVLAAVAFITLGGKTPDPPPNGVSAPGIFRAAPFRVRLSGPLWQARSVRDQDGVDDFALVADDLPLDIRVQATGGARVASVELRVGGHRQQVSRPDCGEAGCPAELMVTLRPRLRGLAAGRHRVQVYVGTAGTRDPKRVATFQVRTAASVPTVVESLLPSQDPVPQPTAVEAKLVRDSFGVLAAERSRPGLAAALSGSRLTVIQAGPLHARKQPFGATLWVALAAPLRDVRATVPAYVPSPGATGPAYTPQSVRMHVAILRDALIDIDMTTRRVIAFEPGPRSQTLSWKPSQAPAPAGTGDED